MRMHMHAVPSGGVGGGVSWQQKLQPIDCSNLFQYKILLFTVESKYFSRFKLFPIIVCLEGCNFIS